MFSVDFFHAGALGYMVIARTCFSTLATNGFAVFATMYLDFYIFVVGAEFGTFKYKEFEITAVV